MSEPRRPLIDRLRDTAKRQRAQGWNVSADLLFEAADRLSRPRFTAEQVAKAAQAIWNDAHPNGDTATPPIVVAVFGSAARAALSAIGEVPDA